MSTHPLESVFRPRSIALFGVPRNPESRSNQFFLQGLLDQGYHLRRPLYLVNPNADRIEGLRCYPTLLDCPDPVDYVISMVPAATAAGLVEQCIEKGVRCLHLYTGGFSESGGADGAALERELIERARSAGLRVIGPNCIGLYVPEERIAFMPGYPTEPGDVLVLSQSGGNAMEIVTSLSRRGVRFSKVISFGNGRDIDAAALLDYAASDAATRTVIAYVEDVTNGRALFEALRTCARVKPTIVLKGGVSEAGARAARSHSASLTGSREVFEAVCHQAGAALIETLEELEDLVVALNTGVRNVSGPRAIVLGLGGGFSVITSDALARHGIDLPELAPETIEELLEVVSLVGNSVRNPLDVGYFGDEPEEELRAVLRIAAHAPGVDFFLTTMGAAAGPVPTGVRGGSATGEQHTRRAIEAVAELQASSGRPIVSANRGHGFGASLSEDLRRYAYERGVGIFESVTRAGRAIELLLQWRVSREGLPPLF